MLFGGSRGAGKSFTSLMEAAKHYDVPGYGAVIFRRTSPELRGTGSLWEESLGIYRHLGGEPIESQLRWKWPSGAQVQMLHLQHENDKYKLQGKSIAKIVLDEAHRFTAGQFWFLLSCMRSTCGVRPRMLCTFNPAPEVQWLLELVLPYLDASGFPIRELTGVVRYFGRQNGKLRTFASRDEAAANGVDGVTSYCYVPSTLFDNPVLLRKDPSYLAKLQVLPPAERSQFLDGCWYAKQRAGEMIQAHWCPILHHGPLARRTAGQPPDSEIIRWTLALDLAGSPKDGDLVPGCPIPRYAESGRDPDYTAICLLGQFRDSRIVIWSAYRYRDVPGAILWEIKRILTSECPRGTTVVMAQDPGQAGQHQIESYSKELRGLAKVESSPPLNLAYQAAFLARVAFAGQLMLRDPDVSQSWQPNLIRELEGYSSDGHSATGHDDQISALATGVVFLATKLHPRINGALPTLDGPLSSENQIRTRPNWKALHPERDSR